MHRAIPAPSKILQKKWEEKNRAIHCRKLREMRPTVDANSPAAFDHLKHKAKREQLMEGEA
jgi:16S rRNA G966 N2-methylase RsmD